MSGNHILDLLLAIADPADDLLALDFLKGKDLVQFLLKGLVEPAFILLGPFPARRARVLCSWGSDVVGLELLLELIVVDVVVVPILNERRLELSTEPAIPN